MAKLKELAETVKINCGDNAYTNVKFTGKTMYNQGNDTPDKEGIYVEGTYCDGIFTKFDETKAPLGFASVQPTFVSNLQEGGWEVDEANSGLLSPGVYSVDYATAQAVVSEDGKKIASPYNEVKADIVLDPIDYFTADRGALYEVEKRDTVAEVRDTEQVAPAEHAHE